MSNLAGCPKTMARLFPRPGSLSGATPGERFVTPRRRTTDFALRRKTGRASRDWLGHPATFMPRRRSPSPRPAALDEGLPRVWPCAATARMAPTPGAPASWSVPSLITPGALAEWLGLQPRELDWFADCLGREAEVPSGPLRHYTYRWLRRRSGGVRLLEMPRARLKALQRRLLRDILEGIPPHDCAHAYRRSRSLAGYVAPHAGRAIVLRFDLRDFFPSIRRARVHALFRTAGYPPAVARLLAGLCTNVVPRDVLDGTDEDRYSSPHLPQGAPTSPALANLCAWRLDCRLAALAASLGAAYTRYADDLAFSGGGELERSARRFQVLVCRIALEESFEVHTRKSRFMRQGVRQQLAGVVLNVRPNVRRADYDRLKATLCNCVRHGPGSQNRDGHADFRAHLLGRIAHVGQINPERARKLRALFERICW
jgi:RNA-directed DNA polymerase